MKNWKLSRKLTVGIMMIVLVCVILVCEGEHQHIDHRSVEEQDKRREQDKFKELASAYRMVEAFRIEHFEH